MNWEEKIKQGGHTRYYEKNKEQGKLFVRDRLKLLFVHSVDKTAWFITQCDAYHLPLLFLEKYLAS